uniref:Uncharacterized protein n=2 Tax=Paracidobacterium acidisoli TaxID=2303751 RepID=A0A372ILZ6_9BACT
MPSDRAQDSYQIYSMLLPGEPFAQMSAQQTQRWAIAKITINYEDMNPRIEPEAQLKAPPESLRAWRETVHDYQVNKYIRVQLTNEPIRVNHSFTLLYPPEVSELRQAKSSTTADMAIQTKWAAYPGVTFFSEVYFNPKHTSALVYMNNWCASLCQAGTWVYLEKQNGSWVRRSGIAVPGA